MNFIVTKISRPPSLFILALIFSALHPLAAHAEPVLKDASLTEYYIKRRTVALNREETEPLSEVTKTSKAQDFWAPPADSDTDPWKVQPPPTDEETEEKDARLEMLTPYFESLRRWKNPSFLLDLRELGDWREGKQKEEEKGIALPLQSNLQITGHKSVTVELNKTHYFGEGDINRYGGSYGGGSFGSGLDLGLTSSYTYDSFGSGLGGGYGSRSGGGYGGRYGGGYGSGFGTGSYGVPRDTGINIRQTLEVGLHGRVGEHTHVEVDYSDSGGGYGGGYGGYSSGYSSGYSGGYGGAKEQRIRVWYEGTETSILKTLSFGDLTLNLPNTRFLNVNRNLFGLEAVAQLGGAKLTAFGSRSKGISDIRRFSGESRRAAGGRGRQISDANYVKERFYLIQLGDDELLHDSYLPIQRGSEEIYIDDNVASNNQGGVRTVRGYFNLQQAGQNYNMNYETGEIEFLTSISASYEIVVAYEYLGEDGGVVGNPGNVFEDENGDDAIDEEGEEIGYVTIKGKSSRGTESRRVYSVGNRNISPRDYQIAIVRQGSGESFDTGTEEIPYIQIFGLDQNGDGIVDPEFIDFDRGLLTFPDLRPFVIDDPESPYFQFRDRLSNEAIYLENPRTTDAAYTIIADYSFQSETYNVGLFVIPASEKVRLNGRLLQRDVDYTMIYEVGSIRFFTDLDEFDEILVEFERTPFGGALQQTVAGLWLEYSYIPKPKTEQKEKKLDRFERLTGKSGRLETDDRSETEDASFGRSSSGGFGGSRFGGGRSGGFGGGFGGGYSSLGGRSRRGLRTGGSSYFNPTFQKGFSFATGYILNTGQKPARIPDVNGAPSRLQAVNLNTTFGRDFNLAWLLNPLPFVAMRNFPLSINFSGETAFSHNNPNSVGFALIDSMEGTREASNTPTFKHHWRVGSLPVADGVTLDNRALFRVLARDRNESQAIGNYMRNREVPASVINPLANSTEERLVMEVGYDLTDVIEEWGGFSYGLSASGEDFSERQFLEIWFRVRGDSDVTLHIDLGVVSEDSDLDNRLDTEDLPLELEDLNGDGKIDTLDLDLENLPTSEKFRANGSLDTGEDVGWEYSAGFQPTKVGPANTVLDTEDLNGDGVLDTIDAYLEIKIPLNDIPEEWLKSQNSNGWTFLSIPLSAATSEGSRLPNLGFVQHMRFWLQKNRSGAVTGTFEWASIEVVGVQWERGVVTRNDTITNDAAERFTVGTKDNFNFNDYQAAYEQIKDEDSFRKLHPFTESTYGFQQRQQREQAMTLNYVLLPESFGVTSRVLRGLQQGEGQDFSKHDTLKLWIYGDRSETTFVLRLAPSIRTGYRSTYYSAGPFDDPQDQEEDINIFENLRDFYEYTRVIDFDGWKLIEIELSDLKRNEYPDADTLTELGGVVDPLDPTTSPDPSTEQEENLDEPDGHPDGLVVRGTNSSQISIKNVGGILIGLRNDTDREIGGEVWVNEIHLSNPLVRSGWARRANMNVKLGNLLKVNGGYAKQDKDFESSAGDTGRQRRQDLGYSTTSNDFNINTELTLFSWLPIRYTVRDEEAETETRRGSFSSFQSGQSKTKTRDFSASLNLRPLPVLGFALNREDFWNERQGTVLSDLYTGSFEFGLGSFFGLDVQYHHEDVETDPLTATDTSSGGTSSFGSYYGRNRDEKVDSGSISIDISPFESFSLNPQYEIRRTLEKRDPNNQGVGSFSSFAGSIEAPTEDTEEEALAPVFTIAAREHRVALNPRLNRDLLGLRPTINNRVTLSENWFGDRKDARISADVRLGLNIRPRAWFGWLFREPEPEVSPEEGAEQGAEAEGQTENAEQGGPQSKPPPEFDSFEAETQFEENRQRELDRLERMGIDRETIEEAESQRGDWIRRDKAELERKVMERESQSEKKEAGIIQRSIESLGLNTNINFNTQDSLRGLDPGMRIADILQLPDEAEERTQSRQGTRYGFRTSVDPWSWTSLGSSVDFSDNFTKSSSTSYRTKSRRYEGDIKIFNEKNTSSLQLRYGYTLQDRSNINTQTGQSAAHEPSISWSHTWKQTTTTALGIRLTQREEERAGIDTSSFIITPNINIDYRVRIEGGIRLPFIGTIPLQHDLDLSNTLSTVLRRERFGANREERSERYETSLRIGYRLSEKLTADMTLGLSYNNDRVEEGRDFISVASALTVRGEFE